MHDSTSKKSAAAAPFSVAARRPAWVLTGLTVGCAVCAVAAGQVEHPLFAWIALGLAFFAGRIERGGQRRLSGLHQFVFAPSPPPRGADKRGPAPALPTVAGPRTSGAAR